VLTGASGYLGHAVAAELRQRGVEPITAGRADGDRVRLDLARPEEAAAAVCGVRPDVVLNVAAMARMAECEAEPERADRTNRAAVAAIAAAVPWIVQVSTDLVFDGRSAPYASSAPPRPLSAYARSKALGEREALARGGLVVRIPLLFGRSHDGTRGATDMLRRASAEDRTLELFDNEFRTPVHVADAARMLVELALGEPRTGVLHLAGPERVSRYALAERFAALHGLPRCWRAVSCSAPDRPRDVSLIADLRAPRGLAEMLADA